MAAKNSLALALLIAGAGFLAFPSPAFAFGSKAQPPSDPDGAVSSSVNGGETVWVTRPDGAEQCAPGSGQSLGDSAGELKKANVRVLNSQKGNDKKLHAQMCGISSGKTNMFLIPKEDLPKAIAQGFHQVL